MSQNLRKKMVSLKRELEEMRENVRYMSALYTEEKDERERLEDETKRYRALLERQEKYIQVKQKELIDNQDKINLLKQEIRKLEIEKLGVLDGLTKILDSVLDTEVREEESEYKSEEYESEW